MRDTEARHADTHPFPHVILREHQAGPMPGDRPTFTVYLTGWWVADYKTRTGAERGAARAAKLAEQPRARVPEWRPARCEECNWEIEISRSGDRTLCACDVAS